MSASWIILKYLPVLPPGFRPTIILKDNTLARTDLNQTYSKIIEINNKIKKYKAYEVSRKLINHETILLQERVNKLIGDINKKQDSKNTISKKIEGKSGLFRKILLGKNVNYSGRSVITVEPKLRLNQCELPIKIDAT